MMKMKNYLLPVFMVVFLVPMVILVLGYKNYARATAAPTTTTTATTTTTLAPNTTTLAPNTTTPAPNTTTLAPNTTTAHVPVNLEGKMFTMSYGGGGMSFSSPHIWPRSGSVSVCLRYITDYMSVRNPRIFTLSPSTSPLKLVDVGGSTYVLSFYDYDYYLVPNVFVWSVTEPELWTRFCVIVDSGRNVAQVFHGQHMSIRKLLPRPYTWSGEQVLDFSGFDGQLTDVQVWDYPLSSSEVYNYVSGGPFGRYQGSVLSWSSIWYKVYGNTLLEDAYRLPMESSLSRSEAGRHMKFGRKTVDEQLK